MADRPGLDGPNARRRAATVAELPTRGRARARGFISRITILPHGSAPQFAAVVSDDDPPAPGGAERRDGQRRRRPAQVRLVWIGQRRVPGIEAGTQIAFEGMVSPVDGMPTIYNPRYEIIGRPEAQQ
ncbi:OB-fold nucleic acid binding domain-containing protein [Arthrobacter sp. CAN_A1]|uniref:OB-fold nucleic acid binding domain-containing protein n=1 Tax=Arthrobacter sp. CAN_A1 TaxID=2787717 RepID=UPI0018C9E817